MVGGTPEAYARIEPNAGYGAARYKGEPCSARMGPDGAGHFVKTIHNGEYADAADGAEIYALLRDVCGLKAEEIAQILQNGIQAR